MKAAWAEGVDISSDSGLSKVVESVGLSWQDALKQFHNNEWEQMLETNVQDMLTEGLWGVPSFRVSGGNRQDIFSCWGQDRIWRVEAEITQRSEKGR
jgi:2-hydroxychromene-2-carboxylate isomerase